MGPDELRRQAALEDRHFWYTARRRQVRRRLAPAQAGSWALDLGAGSGGNTRLLTEAGYRVVALEHHPVAAEFTRGRGHDVVRGDGHRLPFATGSLSHVMACDVLEHLHDDDRAVAEIQRVLAPGGRLVLTVPADPALWSAHDVALQHVRRYTRESLVAVLTRNGMRVDDLSSWMVLLRPFVLLRRKLPARAATYAEQEAVSDLEPVPAALNAVLALVLRLEHALAALVARRRGVSLIAVATKPAV